MAAINSYSQFTAEKCKMSSVFVSKTCSSFEKTSLKNPTNRNLKIVMTATLPSRPSETDSKPLTASHVPKPKPKTHTVIPERLEVVKSLNSWAEVKLLPLLKPVEKCWQPQDHLPDPESEDFFDQIAELRKRAEGISDEVIVCLVGDMITEEALPTYQTMLNTLDGVKDESGADDTPFAIWTRAWTAEENRHGDLLNKYLYLTGKVNMKAVEKTIQYLIGSGMDPKTENNPYLGYVYTSFQERATFVSHSNTARHAHHAGDQKLALVCGLIAADEKRHEHAYQLIVERLMEIDPTGAMLAFEDMMRKQITMPAHLMFDGENRTLFDDFSSVAQKTGVYTAHDYADIVEFLVKRWKIEKIEGLTDEGRRAQEYLGKLAPRIRKLSDRAAARAKKTGKLSQQFSWVFNREVALL